jgi:glycerol-3-phosphate acyltransferase PlsY
MASWLGLLPVAYLLGTFPTAALVGAAYGRDVTAEGSRNPGASNVYRLAGARAGGLVFAGDAAKGLLAAGAGLLAGGRGLAVACGAAAVVGHCLPATRGFQGGKGVATAFGMAVVAFPRAVLVAAVVWVAVARRTQKASVASVAGALTALAGVALSRPPLGELAAMVGVALLILLRHRANLARLSAGREHALGTGGDR